MAIAYWHSMLILHGVLLALVTTMARLAMLPDATNTSSDNVGSVRITAAQTRQRWLGFSVPNSVIEGSYAYPPLIYWLISRLPKHRWAQARYWANYLADTATVLLVWGAILVLAPALPHEVALLSALAVALNPLLLPALEHARISAPNARSFGALLNTLWMAGLVVLQAEPEFRLVAAALMVPLAWLTVLMSQFGMQSMIGLSLLVSLFTLDPWPACVMAAGIGTAWLVPGLGAREVLRHKWAHWRWYNIVKRTVANAASYRARPWRERTRAMLELFASPMAQGHTLGVELQRSAWWKMLAGVAPFVAMIALAATSGQADSALLEGPTRALAIVCGASFVLFFVTTQPRWVFLGEAERYVEHALAGFAVLAALLLSSQPALAVSGSVLAAVIALTVTVLQLAHRQWPATQVMMQYPALGYGGERELLKRLIGLGTPVRVATLPVKAAFLMHDLLIDEALPGSERVQFYFQHVLQPGDDRFQYMIDDTDDGNEYLRDDLPRLVERYGIDLMVVDSAWLYDRSNTAPILETLRRKPVQYTSGRFSVFAVREPVAASATPSVDLMFPKPKSAREIARERAAAAAAASASGSTVASA